MFSGISCLTRITALSFIVPALLWFVVARRDPPYRERSKLAAIALPALAAVVAPYLVSCALATGDPFYALNYHTMYYRYAEGQPISEPISAADYVRTKIVERPVRTFDTALNGLFVHPFITEWHGFWPWFDGLGAFIRALAAAGLGVMVLFAAGRFLLVVLLASLVPYMLTWNVGGGNEWRFTMHAYPFYLVAAACVVVWSVRLAAHLRRAPLDLRLNDVRAVAVRAAPLGVAVALGVASYYGLPWLVTREAIAHGDSTSVQVSPRDAVFFSGGWSEPHKDGITVRISRGQRSTMRIPLPAGRDYDLVLRMDPVDPAVQRRVHVLMNGNLVGAANLTWDPQRVGSCRVRVQAHRVRAINELTLIPDALVTAGAAGPRFAWLDPEDQVGVQLWYVRVLPQ